MKKPDVTKLKTNFHDQMNELDNSGKPLVFTVLLTFFVMVVTCLAVFFLTVRGEEKVMVPNVIGKDIITAELELQAKELYPKIQLRYSEKPEEKGMVLEQNPSAGAIVKAYRRITLTISRGIALDKFENYVGKNFDELSPSLHNLFSGTTIPITLAKPILKTDTAPEGTILAQFPPAGTMIIDPITIYFIVSNGNKVEKTTVPDIQGMDIATVMDTLKTNSLIFDFTAHEAYASEKANTVLSQSIAPNTEVPAYKHVQVQLALAAPTEKTVTGIFSYTLAEYPYAVPVRLESQDNEGTMTTLADFNHTGGSLTIPYEVKKNTTLILYVAGERTNQTVVK